jgi:hypothetical protein
MLFDLPCSVRVRSGGGALCEHLVEPRPLFLNLFAERGNTTFRLGAAADLIEQGADEGFLLD